METVETQHGVFEAWEKIAEVSAASGGDIFLTIAAGKGVMIRSVKEDLDVAPCLASRYDGRNSEEELPEEIASALKDAFGDRIGFGSVSYGWRGISNFPFVIDDGVLFVPRKFYGYCTRWGHLRGGRWFFEVAPELKMLLVTHEGYGERFAHGERFGLLIWFEEAKNQFLYARVPSRIESIVEAIEFTIPSKVRKAIASGKEVSRDGKVFTIVTRRGERKVKMKETPGHRCYII